MVLICAVILTIAAVSMTPSSEQWEQNAIMDRFAHVYKGSPPDHCVCDQALRQLPNGEFAIIFMTERGLKSIENYWHGRSKDETDNRDTEIAEIQKRDRIL